MAPSKAAASRSPSEKSPARKKYFGKNIYHLGTVDSTQDALKNLLQEGAVEGTIVVAQDQLRGRGRRDKPWHSMPGRGLWMSVLLRPEGGDEPLTWTPLWAGLVVRSAIVKLLGSAPQFSAGGLRLKWPNDVLLDEFKLAGILAERIPDSEGQSAVVLGVGINCLQRREDFPPHLRHSATSLYLATEETFSPDALLEKMILSLEELYALLKPIKPAQIKKAFLENAWGLGERLQAELPNGSIEGRFAGLGPHGELQLAGEDGKIASLTAAARIERA
jgi:BirA family biotin operon repressor/biotin-[acetyl-CoA-carboxylase] ligase